MGRKVDIDEQLKADGGIVQLSTARTAIFTEIALMGFCGLFVWMLFDKHREFASIAPVSYACLAVIVSILVFAPPCKISFDTVRGSYRLTKGWIIPWSVRCGSIQDLYALRLKSIRSKNANFYTLDVLRTERRILVRVGEWTVEDDARRDAKRLERCLHLRYLDVEPR